MDFEWLKNKLASTWSSQDYLKYYIIVYTKVLDNQSHSNTEPYKKNCQAPHHLNTVHGKFLDLHCTVMIGLTDSLSDPVVVLGYFPK